MAWKRQRHTQTHRTRKPRVIEDVGGYERIIQVSHPEGKISMNPTKDLPTYVDLVEIRELDVEGTMGTPEFLPGEDRWLWIKKDHGAWDGPHRDWRVSHREKYFKYLKKREVVVSAGANQGMYIRFFAKKFDTVYAFEPDPLNFHCMVVNNQVDNVVKMNCALGREAGWCCVNRSTPDNTGQWTIVPKPAGAPDLGNMRIPIMALDNFNFESIDLLQLDIECAEEAALYGALETIKRCRPVLAIENGATPGITRLLESLKYVATDQSIADKIWIPT